MPVLVLLHCYSTSSVNVLTWLSLNPNLDYWLSKFEMDIVYPHHIKHNICATRKKYRDGKKATAVKVYTVNQESQYLLVQGVPAVGGEKSLLELFRKYGIVSEHHVLHEYPTEEFTEAYLVKYERLQSARVAKRLLDDLSWLGGVLHVCYAPEHETVEDTRQKLQLRRKAVAARLRTLEEEAKEPVKQKGERFPSEYDDPTPAITDKSSACTKSAAISGRRLPGHFDPITGHFILHTAVNEQNTIPTPNLTIGSPSFDSSKLANRSSVNFSSSFSSSSSISAEQGKDRQTSNNPPISNEPQLSLTAYYETHGTRNNSQAGNLLTAKAGYGRMEVVRNESPGARRVPSAHAMLPPDYDGRLNVNVATPLSSSLASGFDQSTFSVSQGFASLPPPPPPFLPLPPPPSPDMKYLGVSGAKNNKSFSANSSHVTKAKQLENESGDRLFKQKPITKRLRPVHPAVMQARAISDTFSGSKEKQQVTLSHSDKKNLSKGLFMGPQVEEISAASKRGENSGEYFQPTITKTDFSNVRKVPCSKSSSIQFRPRQTFIAPRSNVVGAKSSDDANEVLRRNAVVLGTVQGPEREKEQVDENPGVTATMQEIRKRLAQFSGAVPRQVKRKKKK